MRKPPPQEFLQEFTAQTPWIHRPSNAAWLDTRWTCSATQHMPNDPKAHGQIVSNDPSNSVVPLVNQQSRMTSLKRPEATHLRYRENESRIDEANGLTPWTSIRPHRRRAPRPPVESTKKILHIALSHLFYVTSPFMTTEHPMLKRQGRGTCSARPRHSQQAAK